MIENSSTLVGTAQMRVLRRSDAQHMSAAYQRNREHLAPWEPARADSFFTVAGQAASLEAKLALFIAGSDVPWVLLDRDLVIGVMTLSGILRGPSLSAHLGYWVDKEFNGRGSARRPSGLPLKPRGTSWGCTASRPLRSRTTPRPRRS